jgi:hypothetical protein
VDARLEAWCQGDCVLAPEAFSYRINTTLPLGELSKRALELNPGMEFVETMASHGLMVLSQTCDIRRKCSDRPFVEVAPLIPATKPGEFKEVKAERRARYATVPGLHHLQLAADLEQILTVEKAVMANWDRTAGCSSDEERRLLGRQLGRKRSRAALPDDFLAFLTPLGERLKALKKLKTPSLESKTFLDLAEIRVHPIPNWDKAKVGLYFWFILKDEAPEADRIPLATSWLALLAPSGRFTSCKGAFTRYDILKVAEYFDSDQLDFDRLSPMEL